MGQGCWLSGSVNYGTYGIMMRLCHDWSRPYLGRAIATSLGFGRMVHMDPSQPEAGAGLLAPAFSRDSMMRFVYVYKVWDRDDPVAPLAWATATYSGGPTAIPTGGNRRYCNVPCPSAGTGPHGGWRYVWEPVRPR
jgi:hypothetical protein